LTDSAVSDAQSAGQVKLDDAVLGKCVLDVHNCSASTPNRHDASPIAHNKNKLAALSFSACFA
jgi:hypothetical protein